MLIPRRISDKKCRFTAKKITFLEYQRVKRLELTKNITERKRLGSVLFIPEVADEVNSLSHESVQRILHQGSLFHSITTKINNSTNVYDNKGDKFALLCNINENYDRNFQEGTLNDLLYGRLFNFRCLNNHNLCLILSYLIEISQYYGLNSQVLLKLMEQINLNFQTFSISEISHLMYSITKLEKLIQNSKSFSLLAFDLYTKSVKLLFNNRKLDVNLDSCSNISKLLYSLAFSNYYNHSNYSSFITIIEQLLDNFPKYYQQNENDFINSRTVSRDFSLICKSMVKFNIKNYKILSLISDFYYHKLENFNKNFLKDCYKDTINSYSSINLNESLDKLYFMDKVDEKISLKHLFVLLDANEHFGFNDKNLLEELNRYISTHLRVFLTDNTFLKNYINLYNISKETRKNKLMNLIKNVNFMKNDRLNIQKIYSEIPKQEQDEYQFVDPKIIHKLSKYINYTFLFKKFLEEASKFQHLNLIHDNLIESSHHVLTEGLDKEQIMEDFMESIGYLPKVINFKNVWKVLKLINLDKRLDLIPMFYSYLQESSIIFESLELPSEDLYEIFNSIIKFQGNENLLELDNSSRIIQIFIEADLKRDYVRILMFTNMFKILYTIYGMNDNEFQKLNQCGSLDFLKQVLEKYFEDYSKKKLLEFEAVPQKGSFENLFHSISNGKNCENREEMMKYLEDWKRMDSKMKKVVESNKDVFKFVIYNGFMT